jgi:hypothetical protein
MSTNPRTTQYRSQTTPTQSATDAPAPAPAPTDTDRRTAAEAAPRTFEPTNTGDLPPMFDTEADREQR